MTRIIDHLKSYPEIDDVWVVTGDTPYNRYVVARESAMHQTIFTQDDDCITDIRPLIEAYEQGVLVNAMTPEHAAQYPGRQTLLGFGALFDRSMLSVLEGWEHDALFLRESDRVFGTLNPHKSVFPSIKILPHAMADNRLYRQPDHLSARDAINRRIFERTGIRA
jgi:hypothetical protein